MGAKGWSTTNLVVVCLGATLVVFFAGATAAIAAGQTPPTALWAAGGAVSGALIGLLVPAPGSKKALEDAAEKATERAAAHTTLAQAAAAAVVAAPEGGEIAAHKAQAEAAETAAHGASDEAAVHRSAAAGTPETGTATTVLLVFFVAMLALGVFLAAGGVSPPAPFVEPLKSVATAVVALASASGSALIGILAPSPGK